MGSVLTPISVRTERSGRTPSGVRELLDVWETTRLVSEVSYGGRGRVKEKLGSVFLRQPPCPTPAARLDCGIRLH